MNVLRPIVYSASAAGHLTNSHNKTENAENTQDPSDRPTGFSFQILFRGQENLQQSSDTGEAHPSQTRHPDPTHDGEEGKEQGFRFSRAEPADEQLLQF